MEREKKIIIFIEGVKENPTFEANERENEEKSKLFINKARITQEINHFKEMLLLLLLS